MNVPLHSLLIGDLFLLFVRIYLSVSISLEPFMSQTVECRFIVALINVLFAWRGFVFILHTLQWCVDSFLSIIYDSYCIIYHSRKNEIS